jgi:glycogen operon protein
VQDPDARCMGLLLDGRAQVSGIRRHGSEAMLLLIVTVHHVLFNLPEVTGGRDWLGSRRTCRRGRGLGSGRTSLLRAPLYGDRALATAFAAAPGAPTASLCGGRVTGLCFRLE